MPIVYNFQSKNGKNYTAIFTNCEPQDRNIVYRVSTNTGYQVIGHIFTESLGERICDYAKKNVNENFIEKVNSCKGVFYVEKLYSYSGSEKTERGLFLLEQIEIRNRMHKEIVKAFPNTQISCNYEVAYHYSKVKKPKILNKHLDRVDLLRLYEIGIISINPKEYSCTA